VIVMHRRQGDMPIGSVGTTVTRYSPDPRFCRLGNSQRRHSYAAYIILACFEIGSTRLPVAQWSVKMCQTHSVKRLILFSYPISEAEALRLPVFAILLLFDNLYAANLATSVVGCCSRPISSCSLRLTKYLTYHLITLLSVGAPIRIIVMVRLTSPRIPQVEGYGLNLGFDIFTLRFRLRQRASLSPRACPKILLPSLVLKAGDHNLNDPEIGMMLCFISSHPLILCVQ
jgi:hypothetical protein